MPMFRRFGGFRITLAATIAAVITAQGGCGYIDEARPKFIGESGRELTDEQTQASFTPNPYPAATPVARELDIEVVPENGRLIRIDNRTVHSYENAELWLNQQYGGRIDLIAIGHNEPIYLDGFVNEHGEPYPIARFLARDKFSPLVAADLIVDGKMYRLHVRLDDWRHP